MANEESKEPIMLKISSSTMTLDEQIEKLIKSMEQALNTGPIIGESREAIWQLGRNLSIRDMLLQNCFQVKSEDLETMVFEASKYLDERDEKILAQRKVAAQKVRE